MLSLTSGYSSFSRSYLMIYYLARGLDWPGIDWVLQFDCPEDVSTYIHRVGRTARYQSNGNAVLLLLPSERPFVPMLGTAKIPIEETAINPSKQHSIKRSVLGIVAENTEIKHLAQRAFVSYVRSVHLMANKEVFHSDALPLNEYADSLGLAIVPKVKTSDLVQAKEKKNTNHKLNSLKEKIKAAKEEKRAKKNSAVIDEIGVDNEDDDLLVSKKKSSSEDIVEMEAAFMDEPALGTNAAKKRKLSKNKGKKITFDEEGNPGKQLFYISFTTQVSHMHDALLQSISDMSSCSTTIAHF